MYFIWNKISHETWSVKLATGALGNQILFHSDYVHTFPPSNNVYHKRLELINVDSVCILRLDSKIISVCVKSKNDPKCPVLNIIFFTEAMVSSSLYNEVKTK